jgi:hypothetical protein
MICHSVRLAQILKAVYDQGMDAQAAASGYSVESRERDQETDAARGATGAGPGS